MSNTVSIVYVKIIYFVSIDVCAMRKRSRWSATLPRCRELRLDDMLHATDGQMDFRIITFVVWR